MPEIEKINLKALSFVFFSCLFCCNERIIIIGQTDRDVSRDGGWHSQQTRSTHSLTSRTHWFSAHPPEASQHLNNTVITRRIKFSTEPRDSIFICSMKTLKWSPIKIPPRGKLARGIGGGDTTDTPEMIQHPALDHLHRAACQRIKDPGSPEDLSQNKTPETRCWRHWGNGERFPHAEDDNHNNNSGR